MIIMMDTIGVNYTNIPVAAPKVAGYVTGYGGIAWSPTSWGRFPTSGHVRIKQYPGSSATLESDVIDVESGACSVQDAVNYVNARIDAGIQWSTVYGTQATLHAVSTALAAQLGSKYWGHVDCWLANWNLSQTEATALLASAAVDKTVAGLSCRAVQYASPESNPNTLVPGTSMSLREANIDLSVTQDEWYGYNCNWGSKSPTKTGNTMTLNNADADVIWERPYSYGEEQTSPLEMLREVTNTLRDYQAQLVALKAAVDALIAKA